MAARSIETTHFRECFSKVDIIPLIAATRYI